jgi:hypothetical protein
MFSNSIKQRLKILEMLSNKQYNSIPNPIVFFTTEPNQDIYKIRDTDLQYFKNIKDADKLEFRTEQECQEWLNDIADLLDVKIHYQMLKIVDNSHLEHFMYECNRQDSKGG